MTSLFDFDIHNQQWIYYNDNVSRKTFKEPIIIKDFKNLGLIYQGTKRQYAHAILSKIVKDFNNYKTNELYFWDIFGGGGSMSCNALGNGFNVIYNELNSDIHAFLSYVFERIEKGKKSTYGLLDDDFYNFVDRETAKEILKGDDKIKRGFLLFIYNFGAKGKFTYFCNAEKEIFKKQGHDLVVFNDEKAAKFWDKHYNTDIYSQMLERFKSEFKPYEWGKKRKIFAPVTLKLEAIKVAGLQGWFRGYNLNFFLDMKSCDLVKIIDNLRPDIAKKNYKGSEKDLKSLQQLQQLQQLERLQQLEQLEQKHIKMLNLSYDDIVIDTPKDKTIIYLDPPYIGTTDYQKSKISTFDYERFIKWIDDLYQSGYKNIYLSEFAQYNANFKEIWRKEKFVKLSSAINGTLKFERLFKYEN